VIGATLLALVTHLQVLPELNRQYAVEPGVLIYAEVPPSTRLNLSFTEINARAAVKLGVRWQF